TPSSTLFPYTTLFRSSEIDRSWKSEDRSLTLTSVFRLRSSNKFMIPKHTIDQIFEAAIIEDVVGEFVVLKKRGANLLGNCPFHRSEEHTPELQSRANL